MSSDCTCGDLKPGSRRKEACITWNQKPQPAQSRVERVYGDLRTIWRARVKEEDCNLEL